MSFQSLAALELVLGERPTSAAIASMSVEQVLYLDDLLSAAYMRPPAAMTAQSDLSYRAFVPLTPGLNVWAFEAACLFADAITVPDPIDGAFLDRGGLFFLAGAALGEESKGGRELTFDQVEEVRRSFLKRSLTGSSEGLETFRGHLSSAVRFLDPWRPALSSEILRLTSFRGAIDSLRRVISFDPQKDPGLLPFAVGQVAPEDEVDQRFRTYYEVREVWPVANARAAQAQQSESSLVATNPYEWHYIRTALREAGGLAAERTRVDSAVTLALDAAQFEIPTLHGVAPAEIMKIRRDSDEFAEWQSALRALARRLPDEADPYSLGFKDAATAVFQEELLPRIRRIERGSWWRRAKDQAPQEVVTLGMGAAGVAGLSHFLSVSPATFAALPIAMSARLAAGAIFGSRKESAVLTHLVKRS